MKYTAHGFLMVGMVTAFCTHAQDPVEKIIAFISKEEQSCNWVKEYPIVGNLIKQYNLKVGCEVGVAYGLQSKYLLEHTAVEKLYSIDPYRHFDTGYNDFMNFPQQYFDTLFERVKTRLSPFEGRSVLLRTTSTEAAQQFAPNSLDFAYIDANHSYEAVKEDLNAWWDKVRSGGLMIGDDYIVFATTAQAVNEFVKQHKLHLHKQGNKWWFVKP